MTAALLWGCAAAALGAVLGVPFIAWLRARGLGKAISSEGPETHFSKAGTPTFGGLLIFGVGLAVALAAAVPQDRDVLLPLIAAAAAVAIGVFDDMGTIVDRETREAHDRTGMILKLCGFSVAAVVAALLLYGPLDAPRLLVPHYGAYDIGPVYVAVAFAVIISAISALAVTDGVDMLAGGTSAVAFGAYGTIALMQNQDGLATFCFVLAGALCGFLWHNAYPARVFMGDTGSLPLGIALGIVALQTGWWLLLPVIGVVFVAEILSDVIQIGSYRLRGERVFRMAPLHHHFEKEGWPETRVSVRFIIVGIVGALAGVALAALE